MAPERRRQSVHAYPGRAPGLVEQRDRYLDDLEEIVAGLSEPQKRLSPKFFYDARGSELFERITELPEYYLTETELSIMNRNIGEIADRIGRHASLIEFGSGSSLKIRLLLENLHEPAAYVPVDISRDYLVGVAEGLARDYPEIEVLPVAADFTHPFDPAAALDLLKVMSQEAGEGGALLIGADLQKDEDVLYAAYNDEAGITAEFNRNILRRINNEFGGNFELASFHHEARYNPDEGRIEMYLECLKPQTVSIGRETFEFTRGERILTEHSHKYTLEGFSEMAAEAGFSVERVWTDSRDWFSVQYLTRD
jgi:L-histidine N-alpha-methyltransferase